MQYLIKNLAKKIEDSFCKISQSFFGKEEIAFDNRVGICYYIIALFEKARA